MQQNSNNNGYCVVPNSVLRNNELSIKARFLYIFGISCADGWRFTTKGIATALGLDVNTVMGGLKELEAAGLLSRERARDTKGRLGEVKYSFTPCLKKPDMVLPDMEKPRLEKPYLENSDSKEILKKEVPIKELSNKRIIKYAENVAMTGTEYQALVERLGTEQAVNACIEILDNYKGASGRKYKSDYRAILSWVIGEYEKRQNKKPRFNDVTGAAATVARMLEVIN